MGWKTVGPSEDMKNWPLNATFKYPVLFTQNGHTMMRPFERMVTMLMKEDQPKDFKGVAAIGKDAAHPFIKKLHD